MRSAIVLLCLLALVLLVSCRDACTDQWKKWEAAGAHGDAPDCDPDPSVGTDPNDIDGADAGLDAGAQ